MVENVFLVMLVVLPLVALVLDRATGPRIAERHHGHHDTYSAPLALTRALVFAMLFMSGVGLILSWLCRVGVFATDPIISLGFFSSFLLVSFILWFIMRRCRVVTYDTYMTITPFVGRQKKVNYRDITGLTRASDWKSPTMRNIRVEVEGKAVATLWGVLDTDEILMRIDRYDVLS